MSSELNAMFFKGISNVTVTDLELLCDEVRSNASFVVVDNLFVHGNMQSIESRMNGLVTTPPFLSLFILLLYLI